MGWHLPISQPSLKSLASTEIADHESGGMPQLPAWLERYRDLPRPVILFASGQFLINLITTAQFLLLNLFLQGCGLDDPAIAALGSQRFLATLFLALPAGLWLRGKPLKTPLLLGSILFPVSALVALETVRLGMMSAASIAFLCMGFANLLLNVASLPMTLRLAPSEQSSEALSLLFATWAGASVCGGILSTALQSLGQMQIAGMTLVFDEHATLLILTLIASVAPFVYARLPNPVASQKPTQHWLHIHREDWPILAKALVPTLCIATGAGLSIQFMSLFFRHVHHLSSKAYSGFGSISSVMVLIAGLIVPEVKRRLGWKGAIIGVQSIAVLILMVMGLTELLKTAFWALPLAVCCFIFRQPLMSMAGPSTSELTMTYVGERNRELMSACSGAIWSGSWWLAARCFQLLRTHDLPYWQIFLTTAVLYIAGIIAYRGLIHAVESQPLSSSQDDSATAVAE
ncbi:MFS transporter [Luteolibacter pohnpeiensis]|uniref:MFS transporter n=1 Tax=Luteolibacter pohnpeiensis TaxID=454153 RepID=A0A934S300_9BACT|nr:MFS transporter [Luteolibacter pohnpeiensis]MBK1880948.1 MFS transporter [Luteolibacter pohnpeiensis]